MPVKECVYKGKPGFKWGSSGHCYTYTPNDRIGADMARSRAEEQGRAIQANEEKEQKEIDVNGYTRYS